MLYCLFVYRPSWEGSRFCYFYQIIYKKNRFCVFILAICISLYCLCSILKLIFMYISNSVWETEQPWPTLFLICTDCVTSLFCLILFHCVHTSSLVVKAWGQWCFLYIRYWILVVSHHFIKCFLLLLLPPSPSSSSSSSLSSSKRLLGHVVCYSLKPSFCRTSSRSSSLRHVLQIVFGDPCSIHPVDMISPILPLFAWVLILSWVLSLFFYIPQIGKKVYRLNSLLFCSVRVHIGVPVKNFLNVVLIWHLTFLKIFCSMCLINWYLYNFWVFFCLCFENRCHYCIIPFPLCYSGCIYVTVKM